VRTVPQSNRKIVENKCIGEYYRTRL